MKLALLLGALAAFGCERTGLPDEGPLPDQQMPVSYLALGDSYTIGEGVAASARWPTALARTLGSGPPTFIARTGWTVSELESAIDERTADDDAFTMVTLSIGVNDEFRGGEVGAYAVDFKRILERAIRFTDGNPENLTVVSIPDYGVTPFGRTRASVIGLRVAAFNTAAREATQEHGIRWVDVTEISRAMPDAVVADGLHPNAEQYQVWADAIAAAIQSP